MSQFKQKIKFWKDKIRTTKISYGKGDIQPTRDWRVTITLSFAVLVFGGFASFYFYNKIERGELFVVNKNSVVKEVKIDDILLKKTIDDINNRETLSLQIGKSKPIPLDPSI